MSLQPDTFTKDPDAEKVYGFDWTAWLLGEAIIVQSQFLVSGPKTAIEASEVSNPGVLTTTAPHGLKVGNAVTIAGHQGSIPDINGTHVVQSVPSPTTFTIPIDITQAGTGGTISHLVLDSAAIVEGGQRTSFRLLGGTVNRDYRVTNRITTNEDPSQTDDRTLTFRIRQR